MRKKTTARAAGMTQISISMSKDLMERIERAAASDNRNRSNFITNVLQGYLAENGFGGGVAEKGKSYKG